MRKIKIKIVLASILTVLLGFTLAYFTAQKQDVVDVDVNTPKLLYINDTGQVDALFYALGTAIDDENAVEINSLLEREGVLSKIGCEEVSESCAVEKNIDGIIYDLVGNGIDHDNIGERSSLNPEELEGFYLLGKDPNSNDVIAIPKQSGDKVDKKEILPVEPSEGFKAYMVVGRKSAPKAMYIVEHDLNLNTDGRSEVNVISESTVSETAYIYYGSYDDNKADIESGIKNYKKSFVPSRNRIKDLADGREKVTIVYTDVSGFTQSPASQSTVINVPRFDIDELGVTSLESQFKKASNFNQDISNWNISNVTSLRSTFTEAKLFNQNLSVWNTSNVTDMSSTFDNAIAFNSELDWDTSSVTSMHGMFANASSFNQDISKWDVSKVTTMVNMFSGASSFNSPIFELKSGNALRKANNMFNYAIKFNQNISKWEVGNVENMASMFSNATVFNQDLSRWDVSKVTSMSGMFYFAKAFNQPLSEWNVINVANMSSMFQNAWAFNQPLSWQTGDVTDMSSMFAGTQSYNSSLVLNTRNVTNMRNMFGGQRNQFNQDISKWDVSKVEDMTEMFADNRSFIQDLSEWNVDNSKMPTMPNDFKRNANPAFTDCMTPWGGPECNTIQITVHQIYDDGNGLASNKSLWANGNKYTPAPNGEYTWEIQKPTGEESIARILSDAGYVDPSVKITTQKQKHMMFVAGRDKDAMENKKFDRNYRIRNSELIAKGIDKDGKPVEINLPFYGATIDLSKFHKKVDIYEYAEIQTYKSALTVGDGLSVENRPGHPNYMKNVFGYIGTTKITGKTDPAVNNGKGKRIAHDGIWTRATVAKLDPDNTIYFEAPLQTSRVTYFEPRFNKVSIVEDNAFGNPKSTDEKDVVVYMLADGDIQRSTAISWFDGKEITGVGSATLPKKTEYFKGDVSTSQAYKSDDSTYDFDVRSTGGPLRIHNIAQGYYNNITYKLTPKGEPTRVGKLPPIYSKSYSGEDKDTKYLVDFNNETSYEAVSGSLIDLSKAPNVDGIDHWVDEDGNVINKNTKVVNDMKLKPVLKNIMVEIYSWSDDEDASDIGQYIARNAVELPYGGTIGEYMLTDDVLVDVAPNGGTGPNHHKFIGWSLEPNSEVLPNDYKLTDDGMPLYAQYERTGIDVNYNVDITTHFEGTGFIELNGKPATPSFIVGQDEFDTRFIGWSLTKDGDVLFHNNKPVTQEMLNKVSKSLQGEDAEQGRGYGKLELYAVYEKVNIRGIMPGIEPIEINRSLLYAPERKEYETWLIEAGMEPHEAARVSYVKSWQYRVFGDERVTEIAPGELLPANFLGDEFGLNLTATYYR